MVQGTETFGRTHLKSLRNTVLATLSAVFGFILPKLDRNWAMAVVLFTPTAAGAKFWTQLGKFWSICVKILSSCERLKPPVYPSALRYLHNCQKLKIEKKERKHSYWQGKRRYGNKGHGWHGGNKLEVFVFKK